MKPNPLDPSTWPESEELKTFRRAAAEREAAREGFHPPLYCPRFRTDCQSLAQVISTGHVSFVCCGERLDKRDKRAVPQDAYRFCHKTGEGVDVLMNHDRRDMAHIASVYTGALAVVIPCDE